MIEEAKLEALPRSPYETPVVRGDQQLNAGRGDALPSLSVMEMEELVRLRIENEQLRHGLREVRKLLDVPVRRSW